MKPEHKRYLDELRESGDINMYGAVPLLADEFEISKLEAKEILIEWIRTFEEHE
jgi:uncharacterized protein YciI